MPIGDIHSNEPGSGARYNDGKPRLDLVPAMYWQRAFEELVDSSSWAHEHTPGYRSFGEALSYLKAMQHWDRAHGNQPYPRLNIFDLEHGAAVFEYGVTKYAAWNWAKGMPWSVPTGCALRHITKIIKGEKVDDDSGLPHWGHVVCNLIMLDWFAQYYPEGDDMRLPLASGIMSPTAPETDGDDGPSKNC